MRARVLSNGHGNANAIESSSGLIGRSLPRRPPFRLERAIETSRWLTNGKGGGKGEDRLKGQIPVSFLPFVFSYFPMGGSWKHVFKIIAIRMFTIIVYVRICIVIHLFFEKTKTHSRKDSVYRVFFFKNEASKYIYVYIRNIYIYIYFSTWKSYKQRGRRNPGDKRRESFVNFEILIST